MFLRLYASLITVLTSPKIAEAIFQGQKGPNSFSARAPP